MYNILYIIENIKYDDIYSIFEELEFNLKEELYDFIIEVAFDEELMHLLKEEFIFNFKFYN